MTTLIKIPHNLPDDNERLAILNYTGNTVLNSGFEDTHLMEVASTVLTSKEQLNQATTYESSHELTNEIHENNRLRIQCVDGFKKGITYFLEHEDSGKVLAAQKLEICYNKYFKNLPDRKRVTYTIAINNFLEALKNADYSAALDSLEMAEKIELLQQAQTNFTSNRKARAEDEKLDDTPHLRESRTNAHRLIDVLGNYLFFKQYTGHSEYEVLTEKLNATISDILTTARSRHTHENHENEELPSSIDEELQDIHDDLHDMEDEESIE